MDRRAFIGTLAGGVLGAPLVVEGQQAAKVFRIGLLATSSPIDPTATRIWEGFFQELRELGYVEGRNIVIEGRYYGDRVEVLPALAAELVRLQVDVIVVGASPAPETAKSATSTIPIVLTNHGDPVESGLVASLAKPGGNITGMSMDTPAVRGKQLQLLKEVLPRLASVAVLSNPTVPSHAFDVRALQGAARSLRIVLHVVGVQAPSELTEALSLATKKRVGALLILGAGMFFAYRTQLVELAAKSRLPAMFGVREFAEAGGLMAYSPDLRDSFRRAARYVDKILKGAKPGDLPVEQPSKFELVINLKTAKVLGLTIPPSLLARADQVIE